MASARGMSLSFIAPAVREGKPVVQLREEVVEEEFNEWQNALILYVPGETASAMSTMLSFVEQEWNMVAEPTLVFHEEDGYFSVRFDSLDDRNTILCSGPYYIGGKPMIMKPWTSDLRFEKEVFLSSIPLWVQLPNLPLNFWGVESLSRIGSVIGKPLYADECTFKKLRISFARVLIDTDVTKPLPDSVMIADPSTRKTFEQKVVFEWIPVLRDAVKVNEKHGKFVTFSEKDKLIASVEHFKERLDEDEEDQTESARIQELKQKGDPIEERFTEYMEQGAAIHQMRNYCVTCNRFTTMSNDHHFDHICLHDKQKVLNACAGAESWPKHNKQRQNALLKYATPVSTTADMNLKADEIVRLCNPIIMKPEKAANEKEATPEPRQPQKRINFEKLIHQLQQHQEALRKLLVQITIKRQPLLLLNSEGLCSDATH